MHRSTLKRYGVALLASLAALVLTTLLEAELTHAIFAFYMLAVVVASLYGGGGPGVVVVVIGSLVTRYLFLAPHYSFSINSDVIRSLLPFLAVGGAITMVGAARLRAQRRAEQGEEFLAITLRSIGDAVIATDRDGRVTFMNAVAQELTGWSEREGSSMPLREVFDIVSEESGERLESPVEKVLATGAVVGLANHTLLVARDGRRIPIDDSAAPIKGGSGEVEGVVMVFRDVTDRRRVEEEGRFLFEATGLLASSLDYETTLQRVAELAVPVIADWCAVDILDGQGVLRRPAVAHVDPAKVAWAHEIYRRYPPDPNAPTGSYQVIRTRKAEFFPEITKEMLDAVVQDDEMRRIIDAVGFTSAMTVPLVAHDTALGTITLVTAESGRRFTPRDLELATELANSAALAIENARLYEETRRSEEALRGQALRMSILAETARILSSAVLDYHNLLDVIAHRISDLTGDACIVRLISDDGSHIDPLAIYHTSEATSKALRERAASSERLRIDGSILGTVTTSGEPVMLNAAELAEIPAERRHEYFPLLRELNVTGLLIVPMRARGHVIGAITIAREDETRPYTDDDRTLLQSLADRAALYIDNARLYHDADEQRNRFGVTLSSIGDAVIATDVEGRVTFINEVAGTLTGWGPEAIGRMLDDVFTIVNEETRALVESPVGKVLREGKIVGLANHTCLIARDGSEVPIDDSAAPIRDSDGNLRGVVLVFHDITERQIAERELKSAKESAEAANRSKDQFLAVLSHELRTPLTPVLALAHALESDGALPEEMRPFIEIIRRNVELEVHLIDDLLDVVRVSRGKLRLEHTISDIHIPLDNAIAICRGEIDRKKLDLSISLDACEHYALADTARLQQVFWNLIQNAVKFTSEGGRLAIRTFNGEGGDLAIEVADSGIGIEPALLPRIFDAFEQGEQTITRRYGGLGLGLAISKALTVMHGGTIDAASDGPGKGAVFTVHLPTVPSPAMPDATRSAVLTSDGEKRGVRILLVDDHEDTNQVIKLLLERQGYDVSAATTFRQGLQLGSEEHFDILISDIGLPDGSGLDLVRELKARRPVKAIALSGFGMEGDIQRSHEAGFSEHLTKPVTFQKLHEIIRRLTAV